MCNLRLLKIISRSRYSGNCDSKSIYISHGLDCLPNSLKYLEWSHFPLKSLPSNFKPSNLVKLDMYNSKLKELAPEIVNFGNLKEINLSNSKELIKLPDLAQAPKLKCINLTACKNLRRLPDMPANISSIVLFLSGIEALPSSFGSLENIKFLSLQECERLKSLPNLPRNIQTLFLNGCPRLENLPSGIVKVKSLNMLRLSYYKRLKILPEISEIMQHLEDLSLEGTGIQELCPTTQNLIVLCLLNSRNYGSPNFDPECLDNSSHLSNCTKLGCFPSVLLGLNLSFLQLGSCNIQEIPDWLCSLNSLNIIDLSENAFERIPSSIRKLDKLYHLNVSGCKKLRHLPELPPSIRTVNASECTLLHTVDTLKVLLIGTLSLAELEFPNLYEFTFSNCLEMEKSARDSILSYFLSAVHNQMNISSWNQHMAVPTCYPGDEIPEWFSHQWEGSSTTVTLPINCLNNNFLGFATCIVLEVEDSFDLGYHWSTSTKLSFQSNNGEEYYDSNLSFRASIFLNSDHVLMWCNYDPKIKFYLMNLDSIEASFDCTFITDSDENIKVKRCGIRMIYGQVGEEENPISQEDYTIEEEISQELNLSIGSEEIIISRQHDSSNMELQRLENNPRTEFSTVVDGLCPDSSLSTGSLQKIKRFNICGCLPFLSIFIEWKWS
ncbi:LRR domain containing protein, partial [Parasponia andersonii]